MDRLQAHSGRALQLVDVFLQKTAGGLGSDQVVRNLGAPDAVLGEMSTTLTSLADGADLLLTGLSSGSPLPNVAEFRWLRCEMGWPAALCWLVRQLP
jgi:hypothetical protein